MRSNPDGNPYNNWSYPGNINPYTGKIAQGNEETYLKGYNLNSSNKNFYFPKHKINNSNAKMYSKPKSESSILYSFNYGYKIQVLYDIDNIWKKIKIIKVDSSFDEGFVKSEFIDINNDYNHSEITSNNIFLKKLRSPVNTYDYYVNTKNLNVRRSSTTLSSIIDKLTYYQDVEVLDQDFNGWSKVKYLKYDSLSTKLIFKYGYVSSSYITPNNSSSSFKKSQIYSNKSSLNKLTYNNSTEDTSINPYGYGNGNIVFWSDCNTESKILIYLNENIVGTISSAYSETDSDESNSGGTLSIIKEEGTYYLIAISSTNKWEGYVTVIRNKSIQKNLSK